MNIIDLIIRRHAPHALLIIFLLSISVLGGAYIFQYGFGYAPCELCYYQRYPYMGAIVLSAIGLLAQRGAFKLNKTIVLTILLVCGLLLLTDGGIAAYHAGVEYKWWQGPTSCTPTINFSGSAEDRLAQLLQAPIIRCDQTPWSLFGISMAGYNFFIATSLGLFAILSWSRQKKS